MSEKPLFIPLNTEYFNAFKSGDKEYEVRKASDKRWGARHCRIGRAVTLSKGYGKYERLSGVVSSFETLPVSSLPSDLQRPFIELYGVKETFASVIGVSGLSPTQQT